MAATDTERQGAIRKGLAYLYKTQQAEGFWSYPGYEHDATGAALFAFLIQQNKWDSEATLYHQAVDRAISYLLKDAQVTDLSTRDDGTIICPGGDASCKGIAWYDTSADSIYTTGFVAPAMASYGLKAGPNATATSTGPLAGLTWSQIAQGITNAYAASQRSNRNGKLDGTWRFSVVPGGSKFVVFQKAA